MASFWFLWLRLCYQIRNTRFRSKVVQIAPKWDNPGLFRSYFSTFCFFELKYTEIWSENVPNLSHLEPLLPTFALNISYLWSRTNANKNGLFIRQGPWCMPSWEPWCLSLGRNMHISCLLLTSRPGEVSAVIVSISGESRYAELTNLPLVDNIRVHSICIMCNRHRWEITKLHVSRMSKCSEGCQVTYLGQNGPDWHGIRNMWDSLRVVGSVPFDAILA